MSSVLTGADLGEGTVVAERSIDRLSSAHDASHYLLVPQAVLTPSNAHDVARVFDAARSLGQHVTFRSGGTSLSGQAVSDSLLVDTRSRFRGVEVLDHGNRIRVQPGVTVRSANAHLLRHGRKLGPDPASEIACTIGGVLANNSSGMSCGTEQNAYRTLESMVIVLPSGTILNTADADAAAQLARHEPALTTGLLELRDRVMRSPDLIREIERQYSMKNTMGYGLNSLVDFARPIDILQHLIIGSEGTLAFVADAIFHTVPVRSEISTGLLIFPSLSAANAALPALVALDPACIELMDARSLAVAQRQAGAPEDLQGLDVVDHAALLVELHADSPAGLEDAEERVAALVSSLEVTGSFVMSRDASRRAAIWRIRKGLYTAVAGARPSGTTALLEDIAVPVGALLGTCERLTELFAVHGYTDTVIFGHAKHGNIHFLLNERFDDPLSLRRYEQFTEDMVELVLAVGGTLKAEHGTGRIMAPFVRRQFGEELYDVMRRIKRLCDPDGILNPGVLLSDDPRAHLHNLKQVPTVEAEVDRCVECGYCEPACPSKDLTLTPRKRIVLRREREAAKARGDHAIVRDIDRDYAYDGVETCAVDGMCQVACPVDINTGDLVRRLRAEQGGRVADAGWSLATDHWDLGTRAVSQALTVAKTMPVAPIKALTIAGRAVLGAEIVPLYSADLPGGGRERPAPRDPEGAAVVLFASCTGTMFAPEAPGAGAARAFLTLCARVGIEVAIPEGLSGLCCGTPWKSKGHLEGYGSMGERVLPALRRASREGRLPIVTDASSCTEGLEVMTSSTPGASALTVEDSIVFVAREILPALRIERRLGSLAIHHTCSSTASGANDAAMTLAEAVAERVHIPIDWGCCAFAGDRGLLHPELTASATATEAAEIRGHEYDAYVSVNRTCEMGMSRATDRPYRHLLEVLEEASRPEESE